MVLHLQSTDREGPHYRLYDPVFKNDLALWRAASPQHRLTRAPAPMLLVCSTRRSDSCPQAQTFAGTATALGGRVTVLAWI
jgi:arylformamidase